MGIYRQTDGETDMKKLIGASANYANTPTITYPIFIAIEIF